MKRYRIFTIQIAVPAHLQEITTRKAISDSLINRADVSAWQYLPNNTPIVEAPDAGTALSFLDTPK